MRKLRLLLWKECDKVCEGCCNKDWNLETLPLFRYSDARDFDCIMLTGGEPMLYPDLVIDTVRQIRQWSKAPIYLYTAKVDDLSAVLRVLDHIDGITLTLHEGKDVAPFRVLDWYLLKRPNSLNRKHKSLRLNVFKGIEIGDHPLWKIKNNIQWIKNCPLPDDEIFMRLN
jgi:hypothetical protein